MSADALLDDLAAYIRRFVVLGDDELAAVALWIVHAHAIDAAESTGYLNLSSPEKESGKTRLLEVISHLVPQPWLAASISAAVLVRKVDEEKPTLLLDEVDALMKGDKERAEAIRGILNAGYRRSGMATLCVVKGGSVGYQDFHVFGAKALTGLGGLHDTLASRCIPIKLKRRRPEEPVERFRERQQRGPATVLHDRALSWAVDHMADLVGAWPVLPEELSDRAQDVWEPLLAIADLAGGEWPARARGVATRLASGGGGDDDSRNVELLRDIRGVFGTRERMTTKDLLDALVGIEEAPWRDLFGKQLDANALGKRLKGYQVKSKDLRTENGTKKGFEREAFADAWSRYLPAEEPS